MFNLINKIKSVTIALPFKGTHNFLNDNRGHKNESQHGDNSTVIDTNHFRS